LDPSGEVDVSASSVDKSWVTYSPIFDDTQKTNSFNERVNSREKGFRPNRVEVIITLAIDKHFAGKTLPQIERVGAKIDEITTQRWKKFGIRKSLVQKIYLQLLSLQ